MRFADKAVSCAFVLCGCVREPPPPAAPQAPAPVASQVDARLSGPGRPFPPPPDRLRVDLGRLIGTRKDGWNPTIFKDLRRGMSREELKRHFPQAVIDYKSRPAPPFACAPCDGGPAPKELDPFVNADEDSIPGVMGYKFYFDDDSELYSATILFSKRLYRTSFYYDLVRACAAKFGSAKPEDVFAIVNVAVDPREVHVNWKWESMNDGRAEIEERQGSYELEITLEER